MKFSTEKVDLTNTFRAVREASRKLAMMDTGKINEILRDVAEAAVDHTPEILEANAQDLARMNPADPMYDRLKLTAERLQGIAGDTAHVASLPTPLDIVMERRTLANGLRLKKVSVPFGVIGVIYEARPNVTFDVFSLCFKAGSACVLKGGSNAASSNEAIVSVIHGVLEKHGVDVHVCELLPSSREATAELLGAVGYVDMLIPRGSKNLINYVRHNATIPVIETGAGVCHAYFDASGDIDKGIAIVNNAKTRRVSVCNALDCLLINAGRLNDLAKLCQPLSESDVIIYADAPAYEALEGSYPAALLQHSTADSYGTEFLDYKLAVKTVPDVEAAVAHINTVCTMHSECIVAECDKAKSYFARAVDAACVYINAPTSFTDGAQFGLGAEIGISTQKLHARGPMALREITTYKWIIEGEGQIRPK